MFTVLWVGAVDGLDSEFSEETTNEIEASLFVVQNCLMEVILN